MKILVLLLSICPTLTAFAQNPENPARLQPFVRIERAEGTTFFLFNATNRTYAIRLDGLAEANFSEPNKRRTVQLKVGPRGRLERLYIAELQDDLLLAYEVTDGRSRWTYLARLNQKARKFTWITPVARINLGPGLIEDGSAYVSAQNFLAKLDLKTGDFIWQTEIENESAPAFLEFLLPEIHGDRIKFPESGQRGRVIEVEKLNGEIRKQISGSSLRP
jgi:outer membrane protein assembly factor BamB